jgi:uncharacterized integral membrane protein (TIGR00698 family)
VATSVSLPQSQSTNLGASVSRLMPGIVLLAAIGYAGKVIEHTLNTYAKTHHLTFPNIEYVLWAILIGLVTSNILTIPAIFQPGVATYEFWLKIGIVLLGSRFVLADVLRLGGISLGLVVVEISLSLLLMHFLGRVFKLKPKLTSLLAVGSSICGVSAIIAAKGAIDADDEDSTFAIAAILALGALALFTFPLIGHSLQLGDTAFGLWSGLGVDNTAEAAATGALYSDAAGKVAVLAKTCRNAMIGFIVLAYAIYWARRGQAGKVTNKAAFLWNKFPKFVLGFIGISLLVSFHAFSKDQIGSLGNLSRWAFLLTFAGVGLRSNIREMSKQGLRPFVVGALGEVLIAALTFGLVFGANRIWGL